MKQLAVISGKGGTGKSSVVAGLAALAAPVVTADCDVDAADLHLIFDPTTTRQGSFASGLLASIDPDLCSGCGRCIELCRFDAIAPDFVVDALACEGCGVCADHCPADAIALTERVAGHWYASQSRFGPLAHARLDPGAENSGRLVARVREEAKTLAGEAGLELILIDGSPGVGCPVISTITGVDLALVVTEPTVAGQHDLARVLDLTAHFRVPTLVAVNKADLHLPTRDAIIEMARARGARWVGDLPYDPAVTRAMVQGRSVPEYGPSPAADALRALWQEVRAHLDALDELTPPKAAPGSTLPAAAEETSR